MLLMPLVVRLVLVSVGYMLVSLYPVDGVDLACLLASAAVGAALDASEHVSGGHSDPSDDVLCEFHQLCDAELVQSWSLGQLFKKLRRRIQGQNRPLLNVLPNKRNFGSCSMPSPATPSRMHLVNSEAVVCIDVEDVEAQAIVAVFVFELYRLLVEVQRGQLL